MKAQLFLAVVACVGLSAQLFADDPGKTNTEEKTNPPAGRFTIVDRDWAGPIDAGQFLSAIAFSNQLGIDVAPVDPPLRAHLDLKEGQGVVVTSPAADGQSTTSNLKPHDVVLAIDGQQITGPEKFNELVGGRKGKIAMMHILRKGKPMDLEVTFPETPVYQFANQLAASNTLVWADNQYRIGVTLAQADDVLRSQLRLAEGEGLVITDIVADGPSAKAGLRKHDVLVKLDGKRLSTVEACNSQIQEIKDRKVTATVFRGGKEMLVELAPQLSSTPVWTAGQPYSTIMFDKDVAADQAWLSRINLNSTGFDAVHARPLEVHWYADLHRFMSTVNPAATTPAAEQIGQLKRQLEEMQKSLVALEAALQPAKSEQPSEQKPQQKTDKPQP